ncbi:MAG: TolC family protein [Chromatiales bacterium]|nr:TolC family protein [Chromatiales bacterium]
MKTLRHILLTAILATPLAQGETLEDAWRMATERDAGLAAVRSRAEAGRAGELAARAERWPKLTIDGSYQRFDDAPAFSFPVGGSSFVSPELVGGDDFLMGRARVEVPLFTGGRVTAGIESATQAARGAGLAQESYEQDLRLEVATAYVEVLRARRALRAAEATVASLTAYASDVAVMVESEAVARNDLLAARVTLADAEQARLKAENRHAMALAGYNRLLGEPMDRVPELAELPAELAAASLPAASLDELVERARVGRRDLAGLEARSLALAEQARSENASRWPQVGLMADYQHLENQVLDDEDFALLGVGFSWTLFDAGRIRQRANALSSASRAAAQDRDDLQSRVALEVRQAWLDVREALARVPLTREAVEQAEENLRVGRELYGVGLATNIVVLDAEALRLRAVSNNDNAVLDVALGNLRLKRAIGEL